MSETHARKQGQGSSLPIGHMRTVKGGLVDLGALTPRERRVWLRMLGLAGGGLLLHPALVDEDALPPELASKEVLEPTDFRALARSHVRKSLPPAEHAQALRGPLGQLLEDLELRLGRLRHGWRLATLRHDPRQFLRTLYEDSSTLGAFSDQTQLGYSQSSKLLTAMNRDLADEPSAPPARDPAGVGIGALARAAQCTGMVLDSTPVATTADAAQRATCRDFAVQALSAKALALSCHFGSQPRISVQSLLEPEFRGRFGHHAGEMIASTFRLAHSYRSQFRLNADGVGAIAFLLAESVDLAAVAWLFLALEYRWPEEQGFTALLVRSQDAALVDARTSQVVLGGEATQGESIELAPVTDDGASDWLTDDLDLIDRVVFHPLDTEAAPPLAIRDNNDLKTVLQRCRRWGARLVASDELAPFTMAAITAWSEALGRPIPDLAAIRQAFASPLWIVWKSDVSVPMPADGSAVSDYFTGSPGRYEHALAETAESVGAAMEQFP